MSEFDAHQGASVGRGESGVMWPYFPELLATPVPRYTSYPTAAEFSAEFDHDDMGEALDGVGPDSLISLYLHIPFCREICWYCGCNTARAGRPNRLQAYLDHLHREIDLVADRLAGRGCVGRIAFGGGSPNAISAEAFEALVAHVRRRFDATDATLSVEIDPRTLGEDWIAMLGRVGVARASLGVQTLEPRLQAAIGRIQPLEIITQAVDGLRRAGVTSLNVDLVYGLPGQETEALIDSIEQCLDLGADRFAIFGYAHVPHLMPRQRQIDATALPGVAARFDQAWAAYDWLTRAGLVPVGFDHFARIGDPLAEAATARRVRRNFQGFTDDAADILIGLGASAVSSFPDRLLQNEKNFGLYEAKVGSGFFAVAKGVERSLDDRHRARLIERLLCEGEADCSGLADMEAIQDRLRAFEDHGLLSWRDGMLRLEPDATPYARTIASTLDLYRADAQTRFSTAV